MRGAQHLIRKAYTRNYLDLTNFLFGAQQDSGMSSRAIHPSTACHFLRLPVELHVIIYGYVLQTADPIIVRCQEAPTRSIRRLRLKTTKRSTTVHDRSKTCALLQACRLTYLGLIHTYYSQNVFEFCSMGPFNRFITNVGKTNSRLITSVSFASPPYVPFLGAGTFAQLPKLKDVTICFSDDASRQGGYPNMGDMLRLCQYKPSLEELVFKHTSTAWQPRQGRRALAMPDRQARARRYIRQLRDALDQQHENIPISLIFVEIYEGVL